MAGSTEGQHRSKKFFLCEVEEDVKDFVKFYQHMPGIESIALNLSHTARMKKKLLTGLTSLGLLLIIWFVAIKPAGKRNVHANTQHPAEKFAGFKNRPAISYDLYYYKHPYLARAHYWNEKGAYDQAIRYYNEAAIKFEREQQWESYVWVNSYIARLYLFVKEKDYRDAWPHLQKALRNAGRYLGSEHPCTAITLFYLGMYYSAKQQADTALQLYNQALAVLSGHGTVQNIYVSDIYEAIGQIQFYQKFDNPEAEQYYLKAVRIKESLPDIIKDSVLTNSYYNLIELYSNIRDFEHALTYCYKALHYVDYMKKKKNVWLELLEGILATTYSEQQNYREAIPRLHYVVRLNRTHQGDKGYLCFYYNSLGDIYNRIARYDSAVIFYKKALAAANGFSFFENQQLQIATENYSLGMTFSKLKNYPVALSYLHRCLTIRLRVYGGKHRETAMAFQGIGEVYQEANLPDSALAFFQQAVGASSEGFTDTGKYAVPPVSQINTSFYSFLILKDKAAVLKQLYLRNPADINLLRASLAYYCVADTLITRFRLRYELENTRLIFAKSNTGIYEDAIDCAALLYQRTGNKLYCNQAFNFMDKRKASLLLEALHEEQTLLQAGVSAADQAAYHSLQENLAYFQNLLEKEKDQQSPDDSLLQVIHAKTNLADEKFRLLKEALGKKYANYARIHAVEDTISLQELQLFSHRTHSLVLEYFWGEKSVYVLGICGDQSELMRVEKTGELEKYIDLFQAVLIKGYVLADKEKDFASFRESAFNVYSRLVKPMLDLLHVQHNSAMPNLVVIPDGPVSSLSFEALLTAPAPAGEVDYRRLDYLVKTFACSYDYAASLLIKNNRQPAAGMHARVLALGYSYDDSSAVHSGPLASLRRDNEAELPGSAKEIKAISSFMDGQFYLGREATEDVFKAEAPAYNILHLAVHGQADNKNSYSSRLIFKKGTGQANDGSLYAYEIYGIPLKARLAVLSACESGIGKFNAGEGMYSIARGFSYAGCPSILMSLWKVNDYSTASIMADFYRQLAAGTGISQAIREAKLAYIEQADRRSAHPANWAAFAAMGNGEPVIRKSSQALPAASYLIVLIGLVAIGLILARLFKTKPET